MTNIRIVVKYDQKREHSNEINASDYRSSSFFLSFSNTNFDVLTYFLFFINAFYKYLQDQILLHFFLSLPSLLILSFFFNERDRTGCQ